jgi:multisubunit Na+/H+ antiporter MnhE subunit
VSTIKNNLAAWIAAIGLAAFAAIQIWRMLTQASGGGMLLGLILAVLVLVVIFAFLGSRSSSIIEGLGKRFPGAAILQIGVSPQVLEQIWSMRSLDPHGIRGRLNFRLFLFACISHSSIDVYGGVLRTRLLLRIPRGSLDSVNIVKSIRGTRRVEVLQFVFHADREEYILDASQLSFKWGLPLTARGEVLQGRLATVRSVLS